MTNLVLRAHLKVNIFPMFLKQLNYARNFNSLVVTESDFITVKVECICYFKTVVKFIFLHINFISIWGTKRQRSWQIWELH